jgi:hypothetical protein
MARWGRTDREPLGRQYTDHDFVTALGTVLDGTMGTTATTHEVAQEMECAYSTCLHRLKVLATDTDTPVEQHVAPKETYRWTLSDHR